jgi:hypothetical protein
VVSTPILFLKAAARYRRSLSPHEAKYLAANRYLAMESVEVTRARYRTDRITTLFVGESAPASGAFFYHGDSAMLRYMQRATKAVLRVGSGEFLDRFKASGWFLDDPLC